MIEMLLNPCPNQYYQFYYSNIPLSWYNLNSGLLFWIPGKNTLMKSTWRGILFCFTIFAFCLFFPAYTLG